MTNPQSFDELAALVRPAPLHALSAVLDRDGTVAAANASWLHAASREDSPLPLVPEGDNYVAAARRRACDDNQARELVEALESVLAGVRSGASLTYHAGPSRLARWFQVEIAGLGSRGAIVNYIDVTLRRQVEEVLTAVARVAEQVKEGSVLTDLEGRILFADMGWAAMHGYAPGELIGASITIVHPPDQIEGVILPFRDGVLASGRSSTETEHLHRDGSRFPVEVRAAVLRDDHGAPSGFASIARDITERRRSEELTSILTDAGAILADALDPDVILTDLASLLVPRLADWCEIVGIDPDGSPTQLAVGCPDAARTDLLRELFRRFPTDAPHAPASETVRSGAAVLDTDYAPDVLPTRATNADHLELLDRLSARAVIRAPLVAHGRALGVLVLGVSDGGHGFGAEETALAGELARRAALTLDNARLYRELTARGRELEGLLEQLFAAQEEERRRVAYELHDGLAQVLVANHQRLQGFASRYRPRRAEARAELEQLLDLAQLSVRETRRVVAGLRPTVLDDFGLATALRFETDALCADGWEVAYEEDIGTERLPPKVETALYRAAQEAITNARKHAGARRLSLRLSRHPSWVRLDVRDWGRGFDPAILAEPAGPGERVGLAGMQERVSLLGGRLVIQSRPGEGTHVIAGIPLAGADSTEPGTVERASPAQ